MMNVIMLNVVMLNVVMPSVMAPCILQSPWGKLLLKKVFNKCLESLRSIKGSTTLYSEKSPSTGAKAILTLAPWAARQQIGLN
jgi:hypothetical protein